MKGLRFFTPYEWFLLLTITTLNIIIFFVTGEWEILSTIATFSGVLCVVLVAKGHISNYLFGLIQVSLYTYLSWGVGYWGEVALNGLYYVPMQFIGFFMWKNRMRKGSKTTVQSKMLTKPQRILLFITCVLLITAGGLVLDYFDDPMPYLDSTTTVLSVIAMFLMVKTYAEQWYLWITRKRSHHHHVEHGLFPGIRNRASDYCFHVVRIPAQLRSWSVRMEKSCQRDRFERIKLSLTI